MGLKVTNSLHHLSIKSGIQVLRQNNFSPSCLKRRPAPDEVRTRALAYLHCQIRQPILIPIQTANQIATLYYVEFFTLH